MKVEIFAKNYNVSTKLNSLILKKVGRLDKYFDKEVNARVNLRQEKDTYTLELTIFADKVLRAEIESSEDMYTNIDMAVAKVSRQINKYKGRSGAKFDAGFASDMAEYLTNGDAEKADGGNARVVRKKLYQLKPMDIQEAQMQMELLGHNFFVFLDADTNNINVLYSRNDGNVGLIETSVS